ncbi:MAG: hypothetical protein IT355_09065 [Gemmatimonadaceae bacterium]|nr:hypothetical protein [Gemmatimonadaceae bacterium]
MRRLGSLRVLALVLACTAVLTAPVLPQAVPLHTVLLRHGVRIDSAQLATIEDGSAFVRVLPTTDGRDVSVIGAVRLGVSRDLFLRRVHDTRAWLDAPTRSRFGIFSDPAGAADVEAVTVTSQDLKDLRKCRPGDCSTKLPASAMQRLHDEVDWSAPDVHAQVNALARRRLVSFVEEYRDHGNASLPTYDDRPPVRASEAFLAVLAQSAYLNQTVPALAAYLRTFPRGRPAGVADVLYWSEDVVPRLRPILSVTHSAVMTPPELGGTTIIAAKQIYSNHFFEAALEVISVNDREVAGTADGCWIVIERRYRFDNLPRGGILNVRGRAVDGLRDHLLADLRRERAISVRSTGRAEP